jgi:hypothetical protein
MANARTRPKLGLFGWALGFALLVTGTPALADAECREECVEAKVVCEAAAHRALAACYEECTDGDGPCRNQCKYFFRWARTKCAEERHECRVACGGGPALCSCTAGCSETLVECREEKVDCVRECATETREALDACRDLAQDGAPPDEVRACVEAAEMDGRMCVQLCHHLLPCGGDFADCVGECRTEGGP